MNHDDKADTDRGPDFRDLAAISRAWCGLRKSVRELSLKLKKAVKMT